MIIKPIYKYECVCVRGFPLIAFMYFDHFILSLPLIYFFFFWALWLSITHFSLSFDLFACTFLGSYFDVCPCFLPIVNCSMCVKPSPHTYVHKRVLTAHHSIHQTISLTLNQRTNVYWCWLRISFSAQAVTLHCYELFLNKWCRDRQR